MIHWPEMTYHVVSTFQSEEGSSNRDLDKLQWRGLVTELVERKLLVQAYRK